MAITVQEAMKYATELLEHEKRALSELENFIDDQIKRCFDPDSKITIVTVRVPSPRIFKALLKKYEAAGWVIENIGPMSAEGADAATRLRLHPKTPVGTQVVRI